MAGGKAGGFELSSFRRLSWLFKLYADGGFIAFYREDFKGFSAAFRVRGLFKSDMPFDEQASEWLIARSSKQQTVRHLHVTLQATAMPG